LEIFVKSLILCFYSFFILSFSFAQQAPLGKFLSTRYLTLNDDDQALVLVSFTDKGNTKQHKLAKAQSFVSERSLKRRLTVLSPEHTVDEKDFPLEQSYVQAVASMVINFRHELKWFNAVSVVATKRQIEALRALSFVKEIELVGRWKTKIGDEQESKLKESPSQPTTNGINALDYGTSFTQVNQINVPAVHNLGIYGQGVVVGVFDNGFRLLNHEAFASMNIIAMHDFVDHKVSVIPNNPSTNFGSHGVNTLSTIGGYKPGQLIGPAFKASYILARTENDSSETPIEEDNWAKAIEWADSIGVDVTSTSLGYLTYDPPYTSWTWQNMDGNTTLITKAADRAAGLGIVVVNSAGNDASRNQPNTLIAPADGFYVIAVGAVDAAGNRASFSSYGPTVDGRIKPEVMAMGVGVKAASASNPASYVSVSGTSFSCPLSAGVAALIRCANPRLTPMQVYAALRLTARDASKPNDFHGWGILNADSAIKYFGALPLGRIGGTMFNDINGNGVKDAGELPIAGATIHLMGAATKFTLTNASGNYSFDSLAIGSYTVTEDVPAGWIQTIPSGSFSLTLLHGVDTAGLNFGIHNTTGTITGSISAADSNDRNGVIVTIIGQNKTTSTDSHGNFLFTSVASGPIRVQAGKLGYCNAVIDTTLLESQTLVLTLELVKIIRDTAATVQTSKYITSISNMGNIGSVNIAVDSTQAGFQWHGEQELKEASLMIGVDSTRVSDAARFIFGISQNNLDHDFQSLSDVIIRNSGPDSTITLTSFDDSRSNFPPGIPSKPLGIQVTQESYSFPDSQNAGSLLLKLTLVNTTSITLSNLLIGYFIDWDIQPIPNNNRGDIITIQNQINGVNGGRPFNAEIAVQRDGTIGKRFMGVVPLSQARFKAARIASINQEIIPLPPDGGLTESNKYIYMRDRRVDSTYTDFGIEENLCMIVSLGGSSGGAYNSSTFTLPGYSSLNVGFAFVGGSDSLEFINNALYAQKKWITLGNPIDIITDIHEEKTLLPTSFVLYQNYPNPFNPATIIRYSLPVSCWVTLKVYNVLGQEVATLVNEKREAGKYEIEFSAEGGSASGGDGSRLTSGVYFYRLCAGSFVETKKFLLMK
jgi:serine protease AprX